LSVEALEDRTTPTFLTRPGGGPLGQQIVVNGAAVPTGGLSVAAGDVIPDDDTPFGFANNEYVLGTGPGTQALVRVYTQDGTLLRQFAPFGDFQGGINVAVGRVINTPLSNDLFGDPIVEQQIVVAVGTGGPPHVKVFSGTGRELASFMAFDTGFAGGLNIAVGNVLGGIGDGGLPNDPANAGFLQEIIIGAASGGSPHVVVTDGRGTVVRSFLAFDLGFRGGVTVAAADVDTNATLAFLTGDAASDTNAYDEIIVGSAIGASHVRGFEVFTGAITERLSFFAFDPGLANGGHGDGRGDRRRPRGRNLRRPARQHLPRPCGCSTWAARCGPSSSRSRRSTARWSTSRSPT
jgi:hypothetical protein